MSDSNFCIRLLLRRFCHEVLPDWRPALTPKQLKPAASVMSVRYRGVTHRITYTWVIHCCLSSYHSCIGVPCRQETASRC